MTRITHSLLRDRAIDLMIETGLGWLVCQVRIGPDKPTIRYHVEMARPDESYQTVAAPLTAKECLTYLDAFSHGWGERQLREERIVSS